MSYFKDIDMWLGILLAPLSEPTREKVKREIKAKILESYHNGVAVGREQAAEAHGTVPDPGTGALRAAFDALGREVAELESRFNAAATAHQESPDEPSHEIRQSQTPRAWRAGRRGQSHRSH